VTQTRLVPSAVVTMSFALEVQVGREPGPPGAITIGIAHPLLLGFLVGWRTSRHFAAMPKFGRYRREADILARGPYPAFPEYLTKWAVLQFTLLLSDAEIPG